MRPFNHIAIRTTTPFDGGLSPLSDKSKGVPLFGNTPLIQDLINGEKGGFNDIKSRGNWSSEQQEEKTYHEQGSEYRLDDDLRKLDIERAKGRVRKERWVAEMEDGSRYEFPSQEVANSQVKIMGKPLRRIFKRIAADTSAVADIMEGCVSVVSTNANGKRGIGAAFCISDGVFITCAHVIMPYRIGEDNDEQYFMSQAIDIKVNRDGQSAQGTVVKISLAMDIAVIEADLPSIPLHLSDGVEHDVGEPVVVVGSPKGYENNVSEGIISGVNRTVFYHDEAPKHIFTDAKILPGNSGGPMVSLQDGTVVGMIEIIVGDNAPYGLNAAIESQYIVNFLKDYKR